MGFRNLNVEKMEQALNDYYTNRFVSTGEILKKYRISKTLFYKYIKENNFPLRGERDKGRKYFFNMNKIKQDSHEKYYWIGFISADGSILGNSLRIQLQLRDKEILENFQSFMETNAPIKETKNNHGKDTCYISINSAEFVEYLAEYNIIANKSLIFTIPTDKIPKEYLFDFIRGLIDGDGTVSRRKNKGNIYVVFYSGNEECVKQMANIWEVDNSPHFQAGVWRLCVEGNQKAYHILEKIYENSSEKTRLDRKYQVFKQLQLEKNEVKHGSS